MRQPLCFALVVVVHVATVELSFTPSSLSSNVSTTPSVQYPRNLGSMLKGQWWNPMMESGALPGFQSAAGDVVMHLKSVSIQGARPNMLGLMVDLVFRDGSYITSHDKPAVLQGLYDSSTGTVWLWNLGHDPSMILPSNSTLNDDDFVLSKLRWQIEEDYPHLNTNTAATVAFKTPEITANWHSNNSAVVCLMMIQLQVVLRVSENDDFEPGPRTTFNSLRSAFRPSTPFDLNGHLRCRNCDITLSLSATPMLYHQDYAKTINYALLVCLVSILQMILLIKQLQHSTHYANFAEVSLLSVGHNALLDSYMSIAHLVMAFAQEPLFHAFTAAALFNFAVFALFEMRMLLAVWKARQGSSTDIGKLYVRFYCFFLVGVQLFYECRSHLVLVTAIAYLFWVPQIVCNLLNDTRYALNTSYVVGTTALRLSLPAYLFVCPKNFMGVEPNIPLFSLVFGVACITTGVLLAQSFLGPRFFIPQHYLPQRYDYFAELPSTAVDGAAEVDCVICMSAVEVHARTERMVTPCEHVFHESCLREWMRIKMECPTCRRAIPAP